MPGVSVTEAITELRQGKTARVRPQGGSMRGRIESGRYPLAAERATIMNKILCLTCSIVGLFGTFIPMTHAQEQKQP